MYFLPLTVALAASIDPTAQEPPQMAALVACSHITQAAERLSCFDEALLKLTAATESGEIVVVDRRTIDQEGQQAFGLASRNVESSLPGARRLETISSVLVSATQSGANGAWVVRLADGSTWTQVDSTQPYFRNEPGVSVSVRRAALGSYLMNVDAGRAFRVRRR